MSKMLKATFSSFFSINIDLLFLNSWQ